jgi:CheY-like chemotaxis protein/PAS domain-containing protein
MPRPEHDHWKPGDVARLLALVETERRYYQELFAALPVPAAVLDEECGLVAANREFRHRFGLEYQDLGRVRLADLLPSDVLEEAAARVVDGRDTRAEAHVEVGVREPRAYRVALQRTHGWQEGDRAEVLLTVEETAPAEVAAPLELPAPLVAWTLDEESGLFTWVSPACEERLGIPEAAWSTLEAWAETRVHADDRAEFLRFYQQSLHETGAGTLTYRLHDGSGRVRRVREYTLRRAHGRIGGVTVELAGEERAQRRAVEAAKRAALERLSGRLAHVANNLLMIVGGYGEELRDSLPDEDSRREDIEEILRAAGRLAALTTQLTGYARPSPAERGEFRWRDWVQGHGGSGSGGDWVLEGNADLLNQLLEELSRVCGPPGALSLEETDAEETREIVIPLPALTPEAAECLFEPFSGPRVGSDPPLGIAALVVPMESAGMEMDLDPESKALRVRLRARAGEARQERACILLVEDEDGIRALIEKALRRAGYEVLSAPWAEQALALSQSMTAPPALLISDIMMRGAGGREVAEQLRARWPGLRVLFITGHHDDPLLEQQLIAGQAAGTAMLLRKPFSLADLLSAVETLAGRTRGAAAGQDPA